MGILHPSRRGLVPAVATAWARSPGLLEMAAQLVASKGMSGVGDVWMSSVEVVVLVMISQFSRRLVISRSWCQHHVRFCISK